MPNATSHDLWLAEQENLRALRKERSELFTPSQAVPPDTVLRYLGIELPQRDLAPGYYRYFPHDFIVEEIGPDGEVSTVDIPEPAAPANADDRRTLYCQMVKAGVFTLEALNRVAATLGIDRTKIGYAGIKDVVAVTSQSISLRGVRYEDVVGKTIPGVVLKNFRYGNGAVTVGQLQGNRFTILVRTDGKPDEASLSASVDTVVRDGFLNFFGLQRFGSRFSAHVFGKHLFRNDPLQALKVFLFGTNPTEVSHLQAVRKEAEAQRHDPGAVERLYRRFPYSLRVELAVLERLVQNPDDLRGALMAIQEQVRLWVYAYTSLLFNKKLSSLNKVGTLPDELPLVTSPEESDRALYADLLREDGTENFPTALRNLPFLRNQRRMLAARIRPDLHSLQCMDEGALFYFSLPKGCYATTFLMNFFTLTMESPVPAWVSTNELDALALTNRGNLDSTKNYLNDFMRSREQRDAGVSDDLPEE